MARKALNKHDKEDLDRLVILYRDEGMVHINAILDHKVVQVTVNYMLKTYNIPSITVSEFRSELMFKVFTIVETYKKKDTIAKFYTYLHTSLKYSTFALIRKYEFSGQKKKFKANDIHFIPFEVDAFENFEDTRMTFAEIQREIVETDNLEDKIVKMYPDIKRIIITMFLMRRMNNTTMNTCVEFSGVSREELGRCFKTLTRRLKLYYETKERDKLIEQDLV